MNKSMNRTYWPLYLPLVAVTLAFLFITPWGWAQDSATDNPVQNDGFETIAPAPWQWNIANGADATGTIDNTESHGGKQSYHILNHSAVQANVYAQLRQYVAGLQPNTSYLISAWVKGKDATRGHLYCGAGWKIGAAFPTGTYDWTCITTLFTTGDVADKYEIVFVVDGPAEVWLDDVSITKADAPKTSASLFAPSLRENVMASSRFYPVLRNGTLNQASLPKVALRSDSTPSFGADFQATCDAKGFFF